MKIRNDHLRALQETELQRAKTQKTGGDFTDLLARELTANNAEAGGKAADPSASLLGMGSAANIKNPALLELQATLAPGDMQAAALGIFENAASDMESMFSTFETYADQLALNDKANLRQAYSLLENISGKISEFKARYPDMANEQPGMAALVNELDVLTTTETFKFNRGDYL